VRDVSRAREEASDGQTFAFPLSLSRGRSESLQPERAPFPAGEHGERGAAMLLPVRLVSLLLQQRGNVPASLALGSPRQDPGTGKSPMVGFVGRERAVTIGTETFSRARDHAYACRLCRRVIASIERYTKRNNRET